LKNRGHIRIPAWVPGLIISAIAFLLLIRFIDLEMFIKTIQNLRFLDIMIFSMFLLLSLIVRSAAWKYLLIGVPYKDAFLIINEGYFFNNLIPRSGEIARTILTSGISSLRVMEVAASILFERGLDVIIASTMFLVTLPLAISLSWIKPIALFLLFSLLGLVVLMLVVAANSTPLEKKIQAVQSNNKFVKRYIIGGAVKLTQSLRLLNRPKDIAIAVMLIALTWVVWTLMLFFGIRTIMPNAPFWWSVFAEGVLALGIAIPSAPANLGVYEGTMVAALAVFGINTSQALSLAVTLHFIQILITSIFGIYGLISQGHTIAGMMKQIRARFSAEKKDKEIEV